MIKLEEINENIEINKNCTFIDHIVWMQRTFEIARANSTGQEYDKICKLQDDLDEMFNWIFNS